MTRASEIEDDFTRVLALARAALSARDDAASWARSPEKAIGHHGACCDALWVELERLVQIHDGRTPTLEHPSMTARRIAKRIRGDIIREILEIATERLEMVIDGGLVWEEPDGLTRQEVEDLN